MIFAGSSLVGQTCLPDKHYVEGIGCVNNLPALQADESAEHHNARLKFDQASDMCAMLQKQYEAIEYKIEDIALNSKHSVHPVVTTCQTLDERSSEVSKTILELNGLIDEEHQEYLRHTRRMIELGANPKKLPPEKKLEGEPVPPYLLRQLIEITVAHDRIVKELPTLEARLHHADDCVSVYKKTIDEKVVDLTTRESTQIKACKDLDLYPPDK